MHANNDANLAAIQHMFLRRAEAAYRMRTHIFTRYTRSGASSRLRTMQYTEVLRLAGINPSVAPFFDHAYLEKLYAGKVTLVSSLRAYTRRISQLSEASNADLLWLEKEALPWVPWEIERMMLPKDIPLVVDYDDAVFHRYDKHKSAAIRWLLGEKLDRLMRSAAVVTAGNAYLADRAEAAGARRVEIVPTVVNMNAYTQKPERDHTRPLSIGWVGTPSTWIEYMMPMMPVLTAIAEAEGARISVVGAGTAVNDHPLIDNTLWTEASEVTSIQLMDIGIMPLTDTIWAQGKCGYKLIQYMACGLPVVASPVGVNCEIVEHGVNGFLAETHDDWRKAIATLIANPDLRVQMGQAGRAKVEQSYSLQVWGPTVANILKSVVG